jgi:hypothetical protein
MWSMSLCDRRQRAATKVVRCGYLDKDGTGRGWFRWRRQKDLQQTENRRSTRL